MHSHDAVASAPHAPQASRMDSPPPMNPMNHAPAHGERHDAHAGHSAAGFRAKFWGSLALTLGIVSTSASVQHALGYSLLWIPGSAWFPAILGTVLFFYGGLVFFRGAWSELSIGKPAMMTLISLGVGVSFLASLATTFGFFQVDVWWELGTLVTLMLLGHWLEMNAITRARGSMTALAALLPDLAERVSGALGVVPRSELRVGDVILVRPGSRVPVDGTIVDGAASVDESMITGESRAVAKGPDSNVIAGTVVAGGSLRVRVTAVGEATALSGILRLVAAAQASASRAQGLADRAAAVLFYVALGSSLATLLVWWSLGDHQGALLRAATVLIIACPHALGLAIPLVIAISTSLGAKNGLLVKDRLALERARDLDVVVFDKTGTLTLGQPTLTEVAATAGETNANVLGLAAAVEADSEHPLARAITRGAERLGATAHVAQGFEALPGRGVRAQIDGAMTAVGGPHLLRESHAAVPTDIAERARAWETEGRTVLYVQRAEQVVGALAIEDEIRPESAEAVDRLHTMGLRVAMITGDSQTVADKVAGQLGIGEVAAGVLPADKAAAITRFQSGGQSVAMVGDGVNDAPALATADVGIAIGAGTEVAVESAGLVLVRSDPRDVAAAIELSRLTYRKMVQNLIWATSYNVIAIPVAAGLFVRWGLELPMSVGAIAMSLSTLVVAANAQLLRGAKLR